MLIDSLILLKSHKHDNPLVNLQKGPAMLYWTVVFLVVAIVAALFGFGGIAAGAAGIAKVLFFLFLVLFIVSLFMGGLRGPRV